MRFDLFDAVRGAENILGEDCEISVRPLSTTQVEVRVTMYRFNERYCNQMVVQDDPMFQDEETESKILNAKWNNLLKQLKKEFV